MSGDSGCRSSEVGVELVLHGHVGVDTLVRKARVLSLVSLHLGNEVDEVARLGEKLELLSINKIVELILDLNDELDDVKTVETVVHERRVESHRGLLSSSEIALAHVEHVLLDLVAGAEGKGVAGVGSLPKGDLILRVDINREEIARGVNVQVLLEVSHLRLTEETGLSEMLVVRAAAEANVLAVSGDSLGHHTGGGSSSGGH